MDVPALANAVCWLSAIAWAKLLATFLVAVGVAIEFGGDWIARPFEKTVSDARQLQLTTALSNAASANERTKVLETELEKARAETARADANLLGEQRLTARERMRLERLERIVLPRSIGDPQPIIEALKAAHLQPINLAVVDQKESSLYGLGWMNVLKEAGLLARFSWLPKDSQAPSLIVVAVDSEGGTIADLLWQKFQIGQGWRTEIARDTDSTKSDGSLAGIPTDHNCLVVGSNAEAAFQNSPGQPGEGLDQYGRPVPAPQ